MASTRRMGSIRARRWVLAGPRRRDPAQEIVHQRVQSRRGSSVPMCRPPLYAGLRGTLCLNEQSVRSQPLPQDQIEAPDPHGQRGGREEGRRITHADFVAVLGWCNLWSDYLSIAYLGFSRICMDRSRFCSMVHTMRRDAGSLVLSATDLSNFLNCRHRTALEMGEALGKRQRRVEHDWRWTPARAKGRPYGKPTSCGATRAL
jgi:hypothetical protein